MTDQQTIRILLIEDTPDDVQILREALAADASIKFRLDHVDRLSAGLRKLASDGTDIVLLDLVLPDSKGVETVVTLRRQAPHVPIVVLTASDDDELALQALQRGAQDYLVKGYVQVYRRLLGRSIRYAIERKRGEEEVRSAHARTEQLLSSIPSILIEVSSSGVVTHWNEVAQSTLGIVASAALQRPLADCGVRWETAAIIQAVNRCRSSGSLVAMDDVRFARPDGQEGYLGLTFIPMKGEAGAEGPGVLLFGADVTKRKQAEAEQERLQEQLVQAQKMETVGRFAGGISHDFNNFLQAILGFAWLIHSRHQDDPKLLRDVQEIVHAAESASAMIRQLLAFSRRQPLQPVPLDLNQTVRNMERLLQQLVGEQIRIGLRLAVNPLVVNMDPTGIEQILMNLSANARDSMVAGGALTIRTDSVLVDEAFLETRPWGKAAGRYVRLSIQDTGTGMDPATASRIFEPFFTTKRTGRGTGLGLAVVYGLVQQHAGFIDIETAIGQGTTFHLYFPHQELAAGAQPQAASGSLESQRDGRTVVVAEDQEQQRALDVQSLLDAGYRVVGVCAVAGAPEFLNNSPDEVELVVVEVSMMGDHIEETIRRLQSARPTARLLLVTGVVDARCRALEGSLRHVRLLQRPYVPQQLLNQLRRLFEPSTPTAAPAQDRPTAPQGDRPAKPRVLIVDDDPPVRMLCERILQDSCDVFTASCGRSALEVLERQTVDLLLTDLRMPNMDGVSLLTEVSRRRAVPKMLAMTGSLTDDMESRLRAVSLSVDVIHKPFTAPTLLQTVNRVLCLNMPSS